MLINEKAITHYQREKLTKATKYLKTLVLLRHAKADQRPESYLNDFERELTPRGKEDMVLVADYLKKAVKCPDLFITSAARRTYQTALQLLLNTNWNCSLRSESWLYNCKPIEILNFLTRLQADQKLETLMLCGHNPTIGELAYFFSQQTIKEFPTGACIIVEGKSWKNITELEKKSFRTVSPKLLKNLP